MHPPRIVGIGEILWDMLPTGKKLGGAPMNVVYHAQALGANATMVSRIGTDELGTEALKRIQANGIDTNAIQIDTEHATGTVEVELENSIPSYTFVNNVAWDHITWTPELEQLADSAEAVVFGTLAQRSIQSRQTIQQFVRQCNGLKVLDVNIRQPYITAAVLRESLELATIIKLNEEELEPVCTLLHIKQQDTLADARTLLSMFNAKLVCITQGQHGSMVVSALEHNVVPGVPVTVEDTIGAGDSFAAAMIHHVLQGSDLQTLNQDANTLGSWLTTQAGATPEYTDEIKQQLTLSA